MMLSYTYNIFTARHGFRGDVLGMCSIKTDTVQCLIYQNTSRSSNFWKQRIDLLWYFASKSTRTKVAWDSSPMFHNFECRHAKNGAVRRLIILTNAVVSRLNVLFKKNVYDDGHTINNRLMTDYPNSFNNLFSQARYTKVSRQTNAKEFGVANRM